MTQPSAQARTTLNTWTARNTLGTRGTRLLCRLADQQALIASLPPPASWLSASEQARWDSFSSEARRQTFLAGRWLARQTVARWLDSPDLPCLLVAPTGACEVAPTGACEVPGSASVFVSISHHGGHVVCAVADVPVGVDIEGPRPRRDVLALAAMVQGDAQKAALARLPPAEREHAFLRDWTLKEAWLKARQQGLDFALMRTLVFDERPPGRPDEPQGDLPHEPDGSPSQAPDTAVAHHGDLVIAVAGLPCLPWMLDSEPTLHWRRYRYRRSAADPENPDTPDNPQDQDKAA